MANFNTTLVFIKQAYQKSRGNRGIYFNTTLVFIKHIPPQLFLMLLDHFNTTLVFIKQKGHSKVSFKLLISIQLLFLLNCVLYRRRDYNKLISIQLLFLLNIFDMGLWKEKRAISIQLLFLLNNYHYLFLFLHHYFNTTLVFIKLKDNYITSLHSLFQYNSCFY